MRYRQRIAPRWIMLSLVVGGCSLWAPLATASPTYTVTDLGTVPGVDPKVSPGNYPICPLAINSSGQVVGHWLGITSDGSTREGTFLYSGGHMTDVTATGANGLGINDAGTMTRGDEVAINNAGDAGQVVGGGQLVDGRYNNYAFYFDGSQLHNLGTLDHLHSGARGINNSGMIVGSVGNSSLSITPDDPRAFLSIGGGPMVDLSTLISRTTGAYFQGAIAINDQGVIVGLGDNRALELTPIAEPVPEPTTLVFAALCLVYAGSRRLARRAAA